jgi:hypothetical protein
MTTVFRCDYCGHYAPLDRIKTGLQWVEDLDNGDQVVKVGLYCGGYCASRADDVDVAVGS